MYTFFSQEARELLRVPGYWDALRYTNTGEPVEPAKIAMVATAALAGEIILSSSDASPGSPSGIAAPGSRE
jgi:hypothetical protein